jgi:sec-independent protein translocase protein TatB
MPLPAILTLSLPPLAHVAGAPLPPVQLATFGIPDTLFLVVLALIVFGPKKLPEISRQVGKLLYEFRKASNDFKFQIEEELRASEQAERQKELTAQAAIAQPATPVAITAGETVSAEPLGEVEAEAVRAPEPAATAITAEPSATGSEAEAPETESNTTKIPTILPPASGLPVSTRSPYRAVESEAAETPASEPAAEPQALDEMQADAQDAVRAAAADPSYNQTGDAVPTHHG